MVTSINYNGPGQEGYESVTVGNKIFNSGNIIVDWFNSMKYISTIPDDEYEIQMFSSSVDHFIMDGNDYNTAYLKQTDNEVFELIHEHVDRGIMFFVPNGVKWAWEELKTYVKNKENELL